MNDGVFYDGQSAKRRPVRITIIGTDLVIQGLAADTLARWQFADLRAIVDDTRSDTLRIVSATAEDAVLIVQEAALIERIRILLPTKPQKKYAYGFTAKHIAITLVATLLIGTSLYFALPKLVQPIAALVPLAWEKSLGKNVLASIPGADATCHTPEGDKALKMLTTRLSKVLDLSYPVQVTISELKIENAFALPGGYIVIGDKLIAEMESPDELAGVLAHEMAHIAERHPMSRIIHIMGLSIIFDTLFSGGSELTSTLAQGASVLLLLSHSRDDESKADEISLAALKAARIQTAGLATFFNRLAKKHGPLEDNTINTVMAWLRTHPNLMERKNNFTGETSPTNTLPAMSDRSWKALKSICNS